MMDIWVNEDLVRKESLIIETLQRDNPFRFQMKHLDREDIEELGWKIFKESRSEVFSDVDYYSNNLHGLTHYHDTGKVVIWEMMQHDLEGETYFNGIIKNKNKLKDVMEMTSVKPI